MKRSQPDLSRVEASLEKARREKAKAENLIKIWSWNAAVQASQRSIKHSVESLFYLASEEYDSDHLLASFDAVIEKLLKIGSFSLYYREKLVRTRWIVNVWVNIQEELIYAYEPDAKVLKGYADEVYSICTHIVSLVNSSLNREKKDFYPGGDGLP